LVMECHWIKLLLVSRWHVKKSFSSSGIVLHLELNSSLKVESFDQSSLFQGLSISNSFYFNTFRV
jgi:hypothetical protein